MLSKQLSSNDHQLPLVDGEAHAIMHIRQHLLLVVLNIHKIAVHTSLACPLSLDEIASRIAVVVSPRHQVPLSVLHVVHSLRDHRREPVLHRLHESDGAIVDIEDAEGGVHRLHVRSEEGKHDAPVEALEENDAMPHLSRGNVVVLFALQVIQNGGSHNIRDAARHHELRAIAHELERRGQIAHLQGGEPVVDDTRVVHLR